MLKREWGAESNGKLPHLSIPSKTATRVPDFAVEDLPLSRTSALVTELAVKDLLLDRILMMMMMMMIMMILIQRHQYSIGQQTRALVCAVTKAYTWRHGT